MDPKERVIRELAAARRRGDFDAVRQLLATGSCGASWAAPTTPAISGADEVVPLMQELAAVTDGTFVLEPQEVLVTDEHVAACPLWAERDGLRVEGNEIGVYRFEDGRIGEAGSGTTGTTKPPMTSSSRSRPGASRRAPPAAVRQGRTGS
jgi:ketosteroid isomerase-like protein